MDWTLFFLLLIALAAIVQLWIALTNQRRQTLSANFAVEEAHHELERLQSAQAQTIQVTKLAALGQLVAGVAREINAPLGLAQGNIEVVGEMLSEYRELVQRYDAAVQHCLQPVDLLFNADKASLDKLVKHVEEARRKLFEARAAVEKSPLLKDAKELLGDASEGLAQLSSLVLNLKGFSRVDRDGMDTMDLNEGIESALMIAQHQLRDRVKVVKQLQALPKVRCMPSQMNQVFLNLITNAAQAIDGDGTLTIASKAEGGQVQLDFTDTGCGIPDDVLPKIFDPFFTTKPVGEGTGLGLSIVHKIVKGHGGTIKVRTTPRKGTTFSVSLPVNGNGAAAAEPA